jgi:hypothetical protein
LSSELTAEQLAADRAAAAELRAAMARIERPFPVWCMATEPKPLKDITERSFRMLRDSAILYANRDPRGDDPAHYRGVMKDADGSIHWIRLWVRLVKGEKVLEIRRVPKKLTSHTP